MSPQAQLITIAWIPIVFYLFRRFQPQQAVIISFIAAWLFLPQQVRFSLPLIPDYNRLTATCYGIFIAACICDFQRLRLYRLKWVDLPMVIWCLLPFASSISNNLGIYDGLSASLASTTVYGIPYFLGRIYLNNLSGIRKLAMGIFWGGLVYIPLCLLEVAISPQIHRMVYGYSGMKSFAQSIRYGGYRPSVFMQHGLSVGVWMMAAILIGTWLWQAKVIREVRLFGISVPMAVILPVFLITFIAIKSTGAYFYLFYGSIVLMAAKKLKNALPLLVAIATISGYILMGATGVIGHEQSTQIVQIATDITNEDRAQSLEFRLRNEEILGEKARERMLFGWGGWNRNRVYEYNHLDELVDISTTDSLWIISFGTNGIIGLLAIFGSALLPAWAFIRRYPARWWLHPQVAPAAAIATVVVLYMLDCTLNNQPNPVFTLASGGIAGLVMIQTHTHTLNLTKSRHCSSSI